MVKKVEIYKEILVSEEELDKRLDELAEEITESYKNSEKELLVVGILRGAVIFMTNLVTRMDLDLTMDFMAVSSYGGSSVSSGVVRILKDLEEGIKDKDVLIVEDIIDTGLTLDYLIRNLKDRGANSIKIATLLDKPNRRKVNVDVDFVGFKIPDEFVVGYGLDYNQKYRNLPFIAALKEEVYS
ncbi:hypoxanthine phosphoribosyltransferase [Miniphocaeibacter halophilus]|uniref:Hypoxanthine phosphoribosyltransferase n=1 Tax=Miniphocaeibacter halophilus TaxID=2931922 RepID=A0AC61MUE5_9FIRM|nr:hypoxanthine phosphoribosyltransferase [Miniphocaeibacter halophilus]QQK07936.1 hypoxanthine phosphoribosyltransferase [Miniphocaeibacter halophilus]